MTTKTTDNSTDLTLTPNYKILFLSFLFFPILVSLGFWQIDRANEKASMLNDFNSRLTSLPVPLMMNTQAPDYTPVTASGSFDNHFFWLLDNKVMKGQVGYEVIAPFQLSTGGWVLVNRGWIKAPRLRKDLPDIPKVTGVTSLLATHYTPSKNALVVNQTTQHWPRVINAVDIASMAKESTLELSSVYLRISPQSSAALLTDWQVINTRPEKHTAYAVQWFAMALALLLLTVTSNTNIVVYLKNKFSNNHPQGELR